MILLFDIGNSRVKWALSSGARDFLQHGAFVHIGANLQESLRSIEIPDGLQIVAVSSVLDAQWNAQFERVLRARFAVDIHFACVSVGEGGIVSAYEDPSQLGVDRWLALLAAWSEVRSTLCVIDCGTAITVDWLDADARHLGGYVLLGRRLMQGSLGMNVAGINEQDGDEAVGGVPVNIIEPGRNTHECVVSGATLAIKAFLESLERIGQMLFPTPVQYFLTGGDASWVTGLSGLPYMRQAPFLVLRGLECHLRARSDEDYCRGKV